MKPSEYEAEAMRFSNYPLVTRANSEPWNNTKHELLPVYPALAMCGEVAELAEKFDNMSGTAPLAKELGDVLWYVTAAARDLGFDLNSVLRGDEWPSVQRLIPGESDRSLIRLVVACGAFAETIKKAWRDGTPIKHDAHLEQLRNIFTRASRFMAFYGLTWKQVAQGNIEKLLGRRERGTLAGSGDDR